MDATISTTNTVWLAKRLAPLLPLVFLASSCAPAVDPTFGASYDACLLKNSKGVFEAANVSEICARHFERDATQAESDELTKDSRVKVGYGAPATITGSFQNVSDDLIITAERIEADFFRERPLHSQAEAEAMMRENPIASETWNFKTVVNPGGEGLLTGSFSEGQPPSAASRGKLTIIKVISRTGK